MGFGLSIIGLGMVFSFIIVVPANKHYFVKSLNLNQEEANMWNDKISGLFGLF